MSTSIGTLHEFVQGSDFVDYIEVLEQYFVANGVTEATKKRAIFLTACGASTYTLVKNLCAPSKPSEKTYKEIIEIVTTHVSPKRIVIAERFRFHKRSQEPIESISEFYSALCGLAQTCNFQTFLDDAIRDQFVCGIKSSSIQKRLLTEETLDSKTALNIALSMESATNETAKLNEQSVNAVAGKSSQSSRNSNPCFRCGKSNHVPQDCFYASKDCLLCKKTGHIAKMCKSKQPKHSFDKSKMDKKKPQINAILPTVAEIGPAKDNDWPVFSVTEGIADPICVKLLVSGREVLFELDTGSAVTVANMDCYRKYWSNLKLRPSSKSLRAYGGHTITVIGELTVNVQHHGQCKDLPIIIVEGTGHPLLGRDWLNVMKLDWRAINKLKAECDLPALLKSYQDIFDEKLGKMKGVKVSLNLKPEVKPIFYKARNVPFALREKVAAELDKLEKLDVLEKVNYSDWATPVVPIMKSDGNIRLCGDYKVTVNKAIKEHQYPIVCPEEALMKLNGGKEFSKLDMPLAYIQLELEEESQECVTINTQNGLYKVKRLPFGVSSSSAIFQEKIDSLLSGIPFVAHVWDDIIISGKDREDHLKNLESVFDRFREYNLKLRKDKCTFMAPSVEYFGYVVSEEGVKPSPSKLNAIKEMPVPCNREEVVSFLGLVNYYRKFISNMSELSYPLTELTGKNVKFEWSSACSESFEKLKNVLSSESVLVHFDVALPVTLACDASPYGLGAVISHLYPDGTEKPIAFASRSLSQAEKGYSQIEREALSIIFALKKFHIYLFGKRFVLYTDNKPLSLIFGEHTGLPVLSTSRIQRWAVQLSAYEYEIKFRPSSKHCNADAFSRLVCTKSSDDSDESEDLHLKQINALPITFKDIVASTDNCPVLSKVREFTVNGWPKDLPPVLQAYGRIQAELTVEQGVLFRGIRVIIPENLRRVILNELHFGHPGMVKMKALARIHVYWPRIDSDIESFVSSCSDCAPFVPKPPSFIQPWPRTVGPWERIHVDLAGPMDGLNFIVLEDSFSKWMDVYLLTKVSSSNVIDCLRFVFSAYGIPKELVSDNGTQFTSAEFELFVKANGIKHTLTPPFHPNSNGRAEKAVQIFKRKFKSLRNEKIPLNQKLARFLLTYRTTPLQCGKTPAEYFFGRNLRTRLDILKEKKENVCPTGKQPSKVFVQGQKVYTLDFKTGKKGEWVEGTVHKRVSSVIYLVETGSGKIWKRHIDQMRSKHVVDDDDWALHASHGPNVPEPTVEPPPAPAQRRSYPIREHAVKPKGFYKE